MVIEQTITDNYALYCGDCMEVMPQFPDGSMHLSSIFATVRWALPIFVERTSAT